MLAVRGLKDMLLCRMPPAANERPSTKSRLPTIEPMRVAFKIAISPAAIRKKPTMSSVRLPSVALRSPPFWGPSRIASCSVASPSRAASGMIASAEVMKTAVS